MARAPISRRINGTIEQLPSLRYRARGWNPKTQKYELVRNLEPSSSGRPLMTWPTEDAADAAIEAWEKQLDGTYADAGVPIQRSRRRPTFAEFAALWLASMTGEQATKRTREGHVRVLNRTFGEELIDEITEMQVRAFDVAAQDAGLAPGTRRARITTLRQIFREARRQELCTANPAECITIAKARVRTVRFLTDQELILMTYFVPAWFVAAVYLGYDCGLRASEIAGLRWHKFNFRTAHPYVDVKDVMLSDRTVRGYPKNKIERRVHLSVRTVDALNRLWKSRPDETRDAFVIRNSRNRPVTGKAVGEVWRTAWRRSGFDGDTAVLHHLRHSCANDLVESGAPMLVVKETLGHGSLATTQGYFDKVQESAQAQAIQHRDARRGGLATVHPINANVAVAS